MSVVQTAYPNRHGFLVAGQIVDTTNCDVDSMNLSGATSVPFGYGVEPDSGERGMQLGASRETVALLSAALNNSSTSPAWDAEGSPYSEVGAGQHIVIDNEILYLSATTGTGGTAVRGQLGTTAAAHVNNAPIHYLNGRTNFRGVAVMDERQKASNAEGEFETGDVMPVLWRGDIAVPVSAAVAVNAHAVMRIGNSATGDALGSFSARTPGGRHLLIPGAYFLTAAADDALAVLRLTGQHLHSF